MVYKHIFVRGNHRDDIFYDKVDMINAWNRIWLSAAATGVLVVAVVLLNNHFHLCICIPDDDSDSKISDFMHHLRMSLSSYFNRRYQVHGSLGQRRFGKADVVDITIDKGEDLRDLICYIHRNPTHHNVTPHFEKWQFNSFVYMAEYFDAESLVYAKAHVGKISAESYSIVQEQTQGQSGSLSSKSSNDCADVNSYIPHRVTLPRDWESNSVGMIIPPAELFPRKIIVSIFKDRYAFLMNHCRVTARESRNDECDERPLKKRPKRMRPSDSQIIGHVEAVMGIHIVMMEKNQKISALKMAKQRFPDATLKQLQRIFSVPCSTVSYWLRL